MSCCVGIRWLVARLMLGNEGLLGKPRGMRLLRDLNVDDRMHLHKVGSKNVDRAPVNTIITPWVT